MARIQTYIVDTVLSDTDLILGSNADNSLDTVNFKLSDVKAYVLGTGVVTSVSGTGTVSGLTLTGTVTSSGNLTLGGTLAVTGTTTLTGALDANGAADIADTLTLSKSSGLGLQVDSNATVGGTLGVTGAATFTTDVAMNGHVNVEKDLIVKGRLNVENYTNTDIINTTTTNYTVIIAEDISLNGRLFVVEDASFNEDVLCQISSGAFTDGSSNISPS